MDNNFFHKIILFFTLPLKNSKGVAALALVILSLVIISAVAINFQAESRQKQTGAILTYTSTKASMIAEAGLRYVEKCMIDVGPLWQCPTALQDVGDWAGTINQDDNILEKSFSGGTFSIFFPGTSSPANSTGLPNDADNLRVISVGSYKGASRSITRFINRKCVGGQYAVTACQLLSQKGEIINPVSPENGDGNPDSVCTPNPPGLVTIPPYTDNFADTSCNTSCNGSSPECPNFDKNNGSHYDASTKLLKHFKFCEMKINNIEVKTSINTPTDNNIYIAKNLEITGNSGLLNLSHDSPSPYENDDTSITVYNEFNMEDKSKIKVHGTLSIRVVKKFSMEDDSELNEIQGEPQDVILRVEENVELKDNATFYGGILVDNFIDVKDNSFIQGWVKSNKHARVKKNAVIDHFPSAGSSYDGPQCKTDVKFWSES